MELGHTWFSGCFRYTRVIKKYARWTQYTPDARYPGVTLASVLAKPVAVGPGRWQPVAAIVEFEHCGQAGG